MTLDFTPEEETQLLSSYQNSQQQIDGFRKTASPYLADTVSKLYSANRDANPGAVVSAAQAVVGGRMTMDQASKLLLDSQYLELQDAPKEKKKGFERWVDAGLSKLRTASRWTFAALNFVPETITGAAAQVLNPNAPRKSEGWFISTDLGTLIANDEQAGDGFFMGGKAAQFQAERARRYRGEIDGKAWTIGRGTAHLLVQPGTAEYNIISGLVDAASAIAIPALPGAQAARGVAATQLAKAGEIGGIGLFTKSAAGLLDAERAVIDVDKVRNWIGSRGARQVVEKISKFGVDEFGNIDEAKRFEEVRRTFSKVQDANFWLEMVDAKSPDEIRNLLLDKLGKGVDDFDLSNRSVVEKLAQKYSRIERLAASMPGQHLVLQSGNSRDVAASISNLDNYLKLFSKSDAVERNKLVLEYTRAVAKGNNAYDALKQINNATTNVMESLGVPSSAIDEIMSGMKARVDVSVHGALDEGGRAWVTDAHYDATDGTKVTGALSTAWLEPEMMKTLAVTLPDARKIRRITGDIGWLYSKDRVNPENFANLKLPVAMVEAFQNELWRPLTLLTPGYVFRNMADSAFRMTFTPGLKGGIFHPLQWIMIASNRRFRGTVLGTKWEQYGIAEAEKLIAEGKANNLEEAQKIVAERVLRDGASEFIQATGQSMRELYPNDFLHRSGFLNRVWAPAQRQDAARFSKGVRDQIDLLHNDEVTKMLAQGYENLDDAVEKTTEYLTSGPGRSYVENLQRRWAGHDMYDEMGELRNATVEFIRSDGTLNEANIRRFVEDSLKRLQHETADNRYLVEAVATGRFTDDFGNTFSTVIRNASGQNVGYTEEWKKLVDGLVKDPNIRLPQWVKYGEEIQNPNDAIGAKNIKILGKRANEGVNRFFSEIYPRRSAYLMQSPVFRQYYYKKVESLIDELDEAGLKELRNNLFEVAKKEGVDYTKAFVSKYVGDSGKEVLLGKGFGQRLFDRLENPSSARGTVTLAEMDAYAKGFALDATKDLFYNAAERSNFADILRIAVPFGTAWAEVIRSWSNILASNPEALRKVGLSVQGIRDADPDADGRGFFYKDAATGEYVFNYPFSDKLGPLTSFFGGMGGLAGAAFGGVPGAVKGAILGGTTGKFLETTQNIPGLELAAPAKSLSMGLNIIPGLGPVAQVAANRILGKLPEADSIRRWLTPYGEPDLTLIPSWAQKVQAAVQDPENNRLLGDMKIETMRALAATGNYELSNPAEQERLESDADSRARILMFLRGLGQFVGPTRPTPEFRVETFAGDKMSAELSKAFRDFQKADYDTAVENFLVTFGEDAFLYMASKSKSTVGGLDASTQFGNFERDNKSLFNQFGDVAGYFAPVGTNFDYQVFIRQLNEGTREKLSPSQLVEEAQAMVGKAIYRNVLRSIGGTPNEEQRVFLRTVRAQLYERYPGFQSAPIEVNRLDSQIVQIKNAVDSPLLEGNKVAIATRQYFDARSRALKEAEARNLQSLAGKKAADLRAWLRSVADNIIAGYPEFERIYNRVLFDEIDMDAGE